MFEPAKQSQEPTTPLFIMQSLNSELRCAGCWTTSLPRYGVALEQRMLILASHHSACTLPSPGLQICFYGQVQDRVRCSSEYSALHARTLSWNMGVPARASMPCLSRRTLENPLQDRYIPCGLGACSQCPPRFTPILIKSVLLFCRVLEVRMYPEFSLYGSGFGGR